MAILVADTSVLIDLERAGLLQVTFSSGLVLVVPDLLYAYELEDYNGRYLREIGLVVAELTADEVAVAQDYKAAHKALSLPDCFALACAQRPNHSLATGDQNLRRVATDRGVEARGVLWLLDLLAEHGVNPATLAQGLMAIQAHPKCMLPRDEMDARIRSWSA